MRVSLLAKIPERGPVGGPGEGNVSSVGGKHPGLQDKFRPGLLPNCLCLSNLGADCSDTCISNAIRTP